MKGGISSVGLFPVFAFSELFAIMDTEAYGCSVPGAAILGTQCLKPVPETSAVS